MRTFMMLGALVALVVAALALPALAQDGGFRFEDRQDYYEDIWDGYEDRFEDSAGWDAFEDRYEDGFEEEGFFAFANDFEDEGFFFGGDDFDEEDFDENGFFFGGDGFDEDDSDGSGSDGSGFDSGINQTFEQEAESGDVSQSFNVSNTGDNSNQCAGVNSVVNTGNIQNQSGFIQYGSEIGDFEQDDIGSNINVGGNSTTTCDQQVNQAASASGR
ncbi:MAG: hypothetical protein WKF67_06645 [Rubrobacteraceae bacterium]